MLVHPCFCIVNFVVYKFINLQCLSSLRLLFCSYLHYGLLAARAEILKAVGHAENPCILTGYQGILEFAQFPLSYS